MNVKTYLTQIKKMYLSLQAMELSLAETRDRAIGEGSPSIDKLNVQTSLPSDPMADAIAEYADMLDEYHLLKRTYVKYRCKAKRFLIKNVPDQDELTILVMRYFEFKSYGEIGKAYGMSYRETHRKINFLTKKLSNCG